MPNPDLQNAHDTVHYIRDELNNEPLHVTALKLNITRLTNLLLRLQNALAAPESDDYYRGLRDGLNANASRSNTLTEEERATETQLHLNKLAPTSVPVRRFAPEARAIGKNGKRLKDKAIAELPHNWEDLSDVFDI